MPTAGNVLSPGVSVPAAAPASGADETPEYNDAANDAPQSSSAPPSESRPLTSTVAAESSVDALSGGSSTGRPSGGDSVGADADANTDAAEGCADVPGEARRKPEGIFDYDGEDEREEVESATTTTNWTAATDREGDKGGGRPAGAADDAAAGRKAPKKDADDGGGETTVLESSSASHPSRPPDGTDDDAEDDATGDNRAPRPANSNIHANSKTSPPETNAEEERCAICLEPLLVTGRPVLHFPAAGDLDDALVSGPPGAPRRALPPAGPVALHLPCGRIAGNLGRMDLVVKNERALCAAYTAADRRTRGFSAALKDTRTADFDDIGAASTKYYLSAEFDLRVRWAWWTEIARRRMVVVTNQQRTFTVPAENRQANEVAMVLRMAAREEEQKRQKEEEKKRQKDEEKKKRGKKPITGRKRPRPRKKADAEKKKETEATASTSGAGNSNGGGGVGACRGGRSRTTSRSCPAACRGGAAEKGKEEGIDYVVRFDPGPLGLKLEPVVVVSASDEESSSGGGQEPMGCRVVGIDDGVVPPRELSQARQCGRIVPRDVLVKVNGVDVSSRPFRTILAMLRASAIAEGSGGTGTVIAFRSAGTTRKKAAARGGKTRPKRRKKSETSVSSKGGRKRPRSGAGGAVTFEPNAPLPAAVANNASGGDQSGGNGNNSDREPREARKNDGVRNGAAGGIEEEPIDANTDDDDDEKEHGKSEMSTEAIRAMTGKIRKRSLKLCDISSDDADSEDDDDECSDDEDGDDSSSSNSSCSAPDHGPLTKAAHAKYEAATCARSVAEHALDSTKAQLEEARRKFEEAQSKHDEAAAKADEAGRERDASMDAVVDAEIEEGTGEWWETYREMRTYKERHGECLFPRWGWKRWWGDSDRKGKDGKTSAGGGGGGGKDDPQQGDEVDVDIGQQSNKPCDGEDSATGSGNRIGEDKVDDGNGGANVDSGGKGGTTPDEGNDTEDAKQDCGGVVGDNSQPSDEARGADASLGKGDDDQDDGGEGSAPGPGDFDDGPKQDGTGAVNEALAADVPPQKGGESEEVDGEGDRVSASGPSGRDKDDAAEEESGNNGGAARNDDDDKGDELLRRRLRRFASECRARGKRDGDSDGGEVLSWIQRASLVRLGFEWDETEAVWRSRLHELVTYKSVHGHVDVPKGTPTLWTWVMRQRTLWRKKLAARRGDGEEGEGDAASAAAEAGVETEADDGGGGEIGKGRESGISDEKIRLLEELGVSPAHISQTEAKWRKRYDALKAFRAESGQVDVPSDQALRSWIDRQRLSWGRKLDGKKLDIRNDKWMTEEKMRLLGEVGLTPMRTDEAEAKKWQTNYEILRVFHAEAGHAKLPTEHPVCRWLGRQLYSWRTLRASGGNQKGGALAAGELTEERQALLAGLGLRAEDTVGKREARWRSKYDELKALVDERDGHANLPEDHALLPWLKGQMKQWQRKNSGKVGAADDLTDERTGLLRDLGFEPNSVSTHAGKWRVAYDELKAFRDEHGHVNLPRGHSLRVWVLNQRKLLAREGGTNDERAGLLTEIGVTPYRAKEKVLMSELWNVMFERLRAFKTVAGHCNVPIKYEADQKLSKWVSTQRYNMKRLFSKDGKPQLISPERVAALQGLGLGLKKPVQVNMQHCNEKWERNYLELSQFSLTHGHCNVPHERGKRLSNFCDQQRRDYKNRLLGKKRSLDDQRMRKLAAIGFNFPPPRLEWDGHFKYLVEFRRVHGHTRVPVEFRGQGDLGPWTKRMREIYVNGEMPAIPRPLVPDEERLAKLRGIGFDFEKRRQGMAGRAYADDSKFSMPIRQMNMREEASTRSTKKRRMQD